MFCKHEWVFIEHETFYHYSDAIPREMRKLECMKCGKVKYFSRDKKMNFHFWLSIKRGKDGLIISEDEFLENERYERVLQKLSGDV